MRKFMLLIALLCATATNSYAYDARATYSSDQLFDSSLQDLRKAMEKAKQNNAEIKAQNRALKAEVAELRQAVNQAGGDASVVEVSVVNPLSDDVLAEKEKKLFQSRFDNISLRLSRVIAQKERMEKNIDQYTQDNKDTQNQIAALQKEVSGIQLALNFSDKTKVSKTDTKPAALVKELAIKKEQISALEKKLAMQKNAMKDKLALNEKYVSGNAALEELLNSGKDELARVKSGESVPDRAGKQKVLDRSLENEEMARREVNDLENYRDRLRESVADLRKASASVKSSQNDNLQKILKIYQEQQALLQQKMEVMQPGSSLTARKENLMSEKIRLESQIALAQQDTEPTDARFALIASAARIDDLKNQLASIRSDSPLQKQNQDLSSQLAVLQQDLQNLRDNPQNDFVEDPQEVKLEIAQLEARRVALANSVQNIYEKFNMKTLSTENLASKEVQLKEYFETLQLEHRALQQKLLTLQVHQDRTSATIQ